MTNRFIPRQQCFGSITVAVIDGLSKAVTFDVAMPDTNYQVFLQKEGDLVAEAWPGSRLTTGFTLNLTIAIAGTISYLAVHR